MNSRTMEWVKFQGCFLPYRLLTQLFLPTSSIPGSIAGLFLWRKRRQDLPKYLAVYTQRQPSAEALRRTWLQGQKQYREGLASWNHRQGLMQKRSSTEAGGRRQWEVSGNESHCYDSATDICCFAHLAPTLLAFLQRTAVLSLSIHTEQDEQLDHRPW